MRYKILLWLFREAISALLQRLPDWLADLIQWLAG